VLPREETWTWDGLALHLDRYETADAKAVIVGLHGGGGYGRMLAPIGLCARRLGFDAVLPDLPGYGLSRVPRRRFKYDTWVACARDLIASESRRSDLSVIALGASMGGMLAYDAAAAGAPLAGIVATTLIDPQDPTVLRALGRNRWVGPLARRSFAPIGSAESDLSRVEPVSDAQILAAIDRAEVHDPHQQHDAGRWEIAAHLGFVQRTCHWR
jgi:alpha-beta hydrolase superfamily lysophospholipase